MLKNTKIVNGVALESVRFKAMNLEGKARALGGKIYYGCANVRYYITVEILEGISGHTYDLPNHKIYTQKGRIYSKNNETGKITMEFDHDKNHVAPKNALEIMTLEQAKQFLTDQTAHYSATYEMGPDEQERARDLQDQAKAYYLDYDLAQSIVKAYG